MESRRNHQGSAMIKGVEQTRPPTNIPTLQMQTGWFWGKHLQSYAHTPSPLWMLNLWGISCPSSLTSAQNLLLYIQAQRPVPVTLGAHPLQENPAALPFLPLSSTDLRMGRFPGRSHHPLNRSSHLISSPLSRQLHGPQLSLLTPLWQRRRRRTSPRSRQRSGVSWFPARLRSQGAPRLCLDACSEGTWDVSPSRASGMWRLAAVPHLSALSSFLGHPARGRSFSFEPALSWQAALGRGGLRRSQTGLLHHLSSAIAAQRPGLS